MGIETQVMFGAQAEITQQNFSSAGLHPINAVG